MKTLFLLCVSTAAFAQGLPFPGPGTAHSAVSAITFTGNKGISQADHGTANVTTTTFAFNSSVTAGHLLKAFVFFCGDAGCASAADFFGVNTVTAADSVGTSYRVDKCELSGHFGVCVISGIAGGSGANTVSISMNDVTMTNHGSYPIAGGGEFAGSLSSNWWDQTGSQVASSSTPNCATGGATAGSGELIYSATIIDGKTQSAGSGFTLIDQIALGAADEYLIGSTAQVETALWTASGSAEWTCVVTADKPQ